MSGVIESIERAQLRRVPVFQAGDRVRVHFLVHSVDGLPEIADAELEREVVQLARTWDDAMRDALAERFGTARGRLLWSIWGAFLPEHYKGYTSPAVAATDIVLLEQLMEDGPFLVSLQPLREHTRVALYVAPIWFALLAAGYQLTRGHARAA